MNFKAQAMDITSQDVVDLLAAQKVNQISCTLQRFTIRAATVHKHAGINLWLWQLANRRDELRYY